MPRAARLPAFAPSRRMLLLAGISCAIAGAFLIAALHGHSFQTTNAANEVRASAALPAQTNSAGSDVQSMRQVTIANDGLVLLQGARVDSVSNNAMKVDTAWGSTDLQWSVVIESGTHFIRADGASGSLDDIRTGDTITVTGTLDQQLAQPTLDAQYVRE